MFLAQLCTSEGAHDLAVSPAVQHTDAEERRQQETHNAFTAAQAQLAAAQQRSASDAERLKKALSEVEGARRELDVRASAVASKEQALEARTAEWRAEAARQVADRERVLSEWQGRVDRRAAEVEEQARGAEVRCFCSCQ